MYTYIAALSAMLFAYSGICQNSVENVLISIRKNNKTLMTSAQYVKSKNLELHTGNYLPNPSIVTEYMIGRPESGGNQLDFTASQSFDFPTIYGLKNKLANSRLQTVQYQAQEKEQIVLLDAKKICIELIYLNQRLETLKEREDRASKLLDTYQARFTNGEISILDLNKAKIQLLNVQSELRVAQNDHQFGLEKLRELNGGIEIGVQQVNYPTSPKIGTFEEIHERIEERDPRLKLVHQQNDIYAAQLKVNRASSLPSFELGYRYQTVLGQTFNGFQFGFSIPLWENKNSVKAGKAHVELGKFQLEEHKVEHTQHIKHLYNQYKNALTNIEAYQEVLGALNSEKALQKALELGEIDFITYVMEIQYYYTAKDTLMLLQKDKELIVAELLKYEL